MRLFAPLDGRRAVAVDIGASAVKVAEAERGPDGPVILRSGWKALPGPLSLELMGDRAREIAPVVRQALAEAGIRTGEAVCALPRLLTTSRIIRLPAASREEIARMLSFEAQQYVPFPLSEVLLAHEVLFEGDAFSMAEVLLVAARKTLVENYHILFAEAGLELKGLGVNALGLWALGARFTRKNQHDEVKLIIDIGAASTDLVVLTGKQPLFLRSLSFGSEALTVAIREDRGLSSEEAESLKLSGGLSFRNDEAMPQANRWLARLAGEIRRSLLSFATERNLSVETAYLCGGGAGLEGLPRCLCEMLDMQVLFLATRQTQVEGIPSDPRLTTAAGIAVRAVEDDWPSINFAHGKAAGRNEAEKRFPAPFRWAAALILIAVLSAAFLLSGQVEERMQISKQIESARKTAQVQSQAVGNLRTRQGTLQSRVRVLGASTRTQTPWLDVVKEINDRFPPNLWLEEIALERGKPITLRGLSPEDGAVSNLLSALGNSPRLSDVRLSYLSRSQSSGKFQYRFLVNCLWGKPPPIQRFVQEP
ncbi:MAG: type IV pilus assembly protein PilM [Armatimonadetes bacterium]|nr:type IV pilus assembly protein PilM [Armatimonadota bacterium]